MVSKIESDRYANTGYPIKDTPPELNAHLFREMMAKTGEERLKMDCQMNDTARTLVWSNISKELPQAERSKRFLKQFYNIEL